MEEKETVSQETAEQTVHVKPSGRKGRIIPLILSVCLLLTAGLVWFVWANQFTLSVRLNGEQEILHEYGEAYVDPGAEAVISGKWLLSDGFLPGNACITVETDLQENVLGKYTVTYLAEIYGFQATATRMVRVVDSVAPSIILNNTNKTVLPGQPYIEEGYVAMDNYDGILTDKVSRVEEPGRIIYKVADSSGNPTVVEREIPYYDPLPPELILEGGENITIPCGTVYSEPGFTARDNADGDMTEDVAIEGEVIWYLPGTYQMVYTIADRFGNVTQKIRTVEVEGQLWPEVKWPNGRVIYLTFDDGPGPYTGALLDLLKRYGVKATFFVTDSGYDGTMWRIVNEGHSIGIHTMTHDYNTIYASEEAFFADLLGMQEIIYRNTGVKTTLMRFPGGGSNLVSDYNEGIMSRLSRAVQDAGFQYFDWNVDSNDAGGALRRKTVAANVIGGVQNHRVSVVLQHDIHGFSVDAVEDIILWGLENGYKFLPLKENSPTMHHTVLN